MPHLRSVHVGTPRDEAWAGTLQRTAIDKHPVEGPVAVRALGLDGDQVADTKHHGGVHQAVYAFAREDLDVWAERVGCTIGDGMFGENLTTGGIDVNEALVGERWRIGSVLFEVSSVRIPCRVFQNWLDVNDYDSARWIKRFTAEGRPGPYLRVIDEGTLTAGDEIVVEHRPAHDVTVSTMFAALTLDRTLLPRLLDVGESLVPAIRRDAESYVAQQGTGDRV